MYKEFWHLFVTKYRGLRAGIVVCGLTLLISLLEGLNIGLLVPLLETLGSPNGERDHWVSRAMASLFDSIGVTFSLGSILLVLAVLIIGTAALKYVRLIIVSRITVDFVVWLRSWNMENLLNTDISYFHSQRIGIISDRLTTQINRAGGSLFQITEIIALLGIILAYLIAAVVIAPVLTGVAFGIMLLVTLTIQFTIRRARVLGATLVGRENELLASAMESVGGIRVIKAFLLEKFRWTEFNNRAKDVGETAFLISRNQGQLLIIQEIALYLLIGGIVYIGVSVMNLEIAVIVTLLFALYRATPRITALNGRRGALATTMAAVSVVAKTIDETSSSKVVGGTKSFGKLESSIELKDVKFSFDDGTKVLNKANFVIEKGTMIGIVGASGAGKSTLIDLLLRHYDPEEGAVLVDGVDLREFELDSWRKSIGLVSQDIFLFNDTIANNIAVGREEATQEKIIDAARHAYADEFIMQLPKRYDTMVGDRGWNLSEGQKQRVALARAILSKPDILILDEATSALDSESESLIQEYMDAMRGTSTVIVVAHRMSTIEKADKIVVLQDGVIVEEGNWDSLLAKSGVFANYHRLQYGGQKSNVEHDVRL